MHKKILLAFAVLFLCSTTVLAQTPQTITLKHGYNFISFTTTVNINPQQLKSFNSSIEDVLLFNVAAGSFLSANSGELTSLEAGKGYIIKSNSSSDISITVTGLLLSSVGNIALKAGFNLVGFSKVPGTNTFSQLMNMYASIKGIYKWNAAAGSFIQVVRNNGLPIQLDDIDPTIKAGESYFIDMVEDQPLSLDESFIKIGSNINSKIFVDLKILNSDKILIPNETINLDSVEVFASYTNGEYEKISPSWILNGAGTLDGKIYTAPSIVSNSQLAATYVYNNITKNCILNIQVTNNYVSKTIGSAGGTIELPNGAGIAIAAGSIQTNSNVMISEGKNDSTIFDDNISKVSHPLEIKIENISDAFGATIKMPIDNGMLINEENAFVLINGNQIKKAKYDINSKMILLDINKNNSNASKLNKFSSPTYQLKPSNWTITLSFTAIRWKYRLKFENNHFVVYGDINTLLDESFKIKILGILEKSYETGYKLGYKSPIDNAEKINVYIKPFMLSNNIGETNFYCPNDIELNSNSIGYEYASAHEYFHILQHDMIPNALFSFKTFNDPIAEGTAEWFRILVNGKIAPPEQDIWQYDKIDNKFPSSDGYNLGLFFVSMYQNCNINDNSGGTLVHIKKSFSNPYAKYNDSNFTLIKTMLENHLFTKYDKYDDDLYFIKFDLNNLNLIDFYDNYYRYIKYLQHFKINDNNEFSKLNENSFLNNDNKNYQTNVSYSKLMPAQNISDSQVLKYKINQNQKLKLSTSSNYMHSMVFASINLSEMKFLNEFKETYPMEISGKDYAYVVIYGINASVNSEEFLTIEIIDDKVISPVFLPGSGDFTSTQIVTISCTTEGATIKYTIDGMTPSPTNGTTYSGPITINTTTTIKAIAIKSGMTDSAVASSTYTISIPDTVATPTFSLPAGTYTSAQSVTIACATSGATVKYTTDG